MYMYIQLYTHATRIFTQINTYINTYKTYINTTYIQEIHKYTKTNLFLDMYRYRDVNSCSAGTPAWGAAGRPPRC
jgi:ABC-type transporter MlaC component